MGLNEEFLPLALSAMNKEDSQNGMLGAPGTNHISISEEHWARVDQVFQDLGVPVSTKMSLEEFKAVLSI